MTSNSGADSDFGEDNYKVHIGHHVQFAAPRSRSSNLRDLCANESGADFCMSVGGIGGAGIPFMVSSLSTLVKSVSDPPLK